MIRMASIFDILGPVMVGPSSSHTAGAARIGMIARQLFGRQPEKAAVYLHGSFAVHDQPEGYPGGASEYGSDYYGSGRREYDDDSGIFYRRRKDSGM